MQFANVLRKKRKELHLTQQQVADQLHVTRQTLSRWENNLSYPNLDTLVNLSEFLGIPLDILLKGAGNPMVNKISQDVRDKSKYKRFLLVVLAIFVLIFLWLSVLGYGRATQNEWIDRANPFLRIEYGYAVLPNKVPEKKGKVTIVNSNSKRVDAFVSDDPFGSGSWLKFYTGQYNAKHRWALIAHKGSYVSNIRLVSRRQIPIVMREQAGNQYVSYDAHAEKRITKRFPWWPFN
ncbi:helix-turn-helix domain-containing protein [Liquorilactobacillus cacaonum]|uniref:XRE family transcriptional regulator n=1 Tax=Liquorilactobacillus cacaonum DSM 21116 TaxID=1423729 RepID=A0A0R2CFL2_9LACO|nr:helix-turn-helix domain-containing protein [Liquorilactobacillus cacaonum]KRM90440.1 XRE family transcriptional regulator [Liquorilactobacillus cacaonum DSM 21116]